MTEENSPALNLGLGLLGGLGSTGSDPTSGSSFVDPSQAPFLQTLREQALAASQGQGVAGFNPLLNAAFGGGLEAAGAGGQLASQSSQALLDNIKRLSDPNVSSDPFLQGSIESATRPVVSNLLENILPSIRGASSLTGNVGSTRRGIAEGVAGGKATEQIGDISSRLSSQANRDRQSSLTQNLGLAPSLISAQFQPLQQLLGLGGAQRGIETDLNLDRFGQLQRFSDILGDPTVLQESSGGGSSGSGLLGLFNQLGF